MQPKPRSDRYRYHLGQDWQEGIQGNEVASGDVSAKKKMRGLGLTLTLIALRFQGGQPGLVAGSMFGGCLDRTESPKSRDFGDSRQPGTVIDRGPQAN